MKSKTKIRNYEVIFFHVNPKSANLVFGNVPKQADSHEEKVSTERLHHIKTTSFTQVSSKVHQVRADRNRKQGVQYTGHTLHVLFIQI